MAVRFSCLAIVTEPVHLDSMQDQGNAIVLEVPPEALSRAKSALTDYAGCFWMRQPAAPLLDRADVELVIRRLRENGDAAAWKAAREIQVCL